MSQSASFIRFSVRQRAEHVVIMLLFTLLVVTGMPQKYPDVAFSGVVVGLFQGINATRVVHRVAGFLFAAATFFHIFAVLWLVFARKSRLSVVPDKKDFTDAIKTLKYYLGLTRMHPRYDRFDYRQKFEYWGMVAGGLIMVFTGFMLFFPVQVSLFLPGQLIPAAKVAHSYEGLMALLVVIVWHIYNAHLNPDVFPFDFSIFSGKISRERMEKEHPLELERLEGEKSVQREAPPDPGP